MARNNYCWGRVEVIMGLIIQLRVTNFIEVFMLIMSRNLLNLINSNSAI